MCSRITPHSDPNKGLLVLGRIQQVNCNFYIVARRLFANADFRLQDSRLCTILKSMLWIGTPRNLNLLDSTLRPNMVSTITQRNTILDLLKQCLTPVSPLRVLDKVGGWLAVSSCCPLILACQAAQPPGTGLQLPSP